MSAITEGLTRVFQSAPSLPLDETSKYILFSDCHRGDNSWADDFAPNQMLLFHALNTYYQQGFTYIEVGDGDELWENSEFEAVRYAHSHIYWLMAQFYREQRLHLIWGNHNNQLGDPQWVEANLQQYFDETSGKIEPLFPGIRPQEGLILQGADPKHRLFVVHTHQGDLINDQYAWLGRFMVRHVWRTLQLLAIHDPTSPAQNFKKRNRIEAEIVGWVQANHQILIGGHTHHPSFPTPGEPPYFNTGSCVHPRCITGVEIQNGEIALIKWSIQPDNSGSLHVLREALVPPERLERYFAL
jgi:UDP-2,3-diacylglucosamine pyrophosphatase LpxH